MKATRINIRKRQISNGRSSLYLDYYPGVFDRIKKRMVRHETLYLYVYDRPETTAQYICNSDALARKAADSLHLKPSRIKRIWSKVRRLFK